MPDHVFAEWHGHSEDVMRAVYSHVNEDDLAAAGDALSAVFGKLRPQSGPKVLITG